MNRVGHLSALVAQVLNALSNLIFVLSMARYQSITQFGNFSVLYTFYALISGVVIFGIAEGSLALRSDDELSISATKPATQLGGTLALVGATLAFVVTTAGWGVGASIVSNVLLSVGILFAIMADLFRPMYVSLTMPSIALTGSVIWLVSVVISLAFVSTGYGESEILLLLGWATGALGSLIYYVVKLDRREPTGEVPSRSTLVRFSGPLAFEFISTAGLAGLTIVYLRFVQGPPAAAGFRILQSAFGPLLLLVAVVRLRMIGASGAASWFNLSRLFWLIGAASFAAFGYATVLWVGLEQVGFRVLQDTWIAARPGFGAAAVHFTIAAAITAPGAVLRLKAHVSPIVRARIVALCLAAVMAAGFASRVDVQLAFWVLAASGGASLIIQLRASAILLRDDRLEQVDR